MMTNSGSTSRPLLGKPVNAFVIQLSALACIGGFLFGYDTGVISGAMIPLKKRFELNTLWQELVVSITVGAAAVFALLGGFMNDWFGRRIVILLASFIFTCGALVLGGAQNREMLVVGRLVVGGGIGLASMTVPIYIAEVAPSHLRGTLVATNTLFITGGQFIASVLDGALFYVNDGWRYMLGIAGIPSLVQFIGFLFMPESPRWLILNGKSTEAAKVYEKFGLTESEAEMELNTIKSSIRDTEIQREELGGKNVIMSMFQSPSVLRALLVGCALQMFQQVSGINTVMYYSATIIQMTGIQSDSLVLWLSAVTAGVNFAFTIVGVFLVDRIGRRPLILASLFGVVLSLMVLSVGFHVIEVRSTGVTNRSLSNQSVSVCNNAINCGQCINNAECGFCYSKHEETFQRIIPTKNQSYFAACFPVVNSSMTNASLYGPCDNGSNSHRGLTWYKSYCQTDHSWIPILGLVAYLFFFAPGMGPMPWTINAEIYPLWARSTGVAMATSVNWIFNLIVSFTFLSLLDALTKTGAYGLYTVVALIGLVFFFLFLPETKNCELEDIQSLFSQPWFSKRSILAGDGHRSKSWKAWLQDGLSSRSHDHQQLK